MKEYQKRELELREAKAIKCNLCGHVIEKKDTGAGWEKEAEKHLREYHGFGENAVVYFWFYSPIEEAEK